MKEEYRNYLRLVESASEMNVVLEMEKYKMKHLAGRFFPQKKCKVLEVGIGKGHHAMFLQQMGHDVQGIDIGDYHKARLEAQGIPLSILDAGKDPFPFKDESFDVVFTSHLLEHLQEPYHFMRECKRVLKNGGVMIHILPDILRAKFKFYDDPTHLKPYTQTSLRRLFEIFGLKVIHISGFELPRNMGIGILRLYKLFPILFYAGRWGMIGIAEKR